VGIDMSHLLTFLQKSTILFKMGKNGNGPSRKTVKKRKELGRVAQASIVHNYTLVEDFISAAQSGMPTPYRLARVEKVYGGGAFEVKILGEGFTVRAKVRQLMHGRGRFHHNPEVSTAARIGGYVLVEDLGLGHMGSGVTHQIMGVLDMTQAARALAALGIADEHGYAGAYNFGSSNSVNSITNALAGLGITPGFVRRHTTARATNKKAKTGGGAGGSNRQFF
jgi:hypothetical protein